MDSPGIKLTPGVSGAKDYPLKRTIGHSALSFATFDPFFQRADSESERAGASVGVTGGCIRQCSAPRLVPQALPLFGGRHWHFKLE